jgi:Lrp/AsnC family leucine-responsive transcriptional regulator
MITEKDLKIIAHMRNNARRKVTEMSKDVKMPVTTIYDKIRNHEKKGIVKKHVTLVDFTKLGFNTKVMLTLTVNRDKREELKKYLMAHPNVNSLYRIDFGPDFIAEVIFQDVSRLQEFIDHLDVTFNLNEIKTYNISQELKKEEFLTKASHGYGNNGFGNGNNGLNGNGNNGLNKNGTNGNGSALR